MLVFNGYRVSVGKDEKILEMWRWMVVMVAKQCKYTNAIELYTVKLLKQYMSYQK